MYPPPPLDARLGKNEQDKLNRGLKIENVLHTVTRRVTHRPIFRRFFFLCQPFYVGPNFAAFEYQAKFPN